MRQFECAHTDLCAKCGFSAYFRAADLPVLINLAPSQSGMSQEELGRTFWMFFPEAIPAVILAICAPFWAIKLFANGDAVLAIFLLFGEMVSVYGFVQGWRLSSKWISYGSMVAFLVLASAIDSVAK